MLVSAVIRREWGFFLFKLEDEICFSEVCKLVL